MRATLRYPLPLVYNHHSLNYSAWKKTQKKQNKIASHLYFVVNNKLFFHKLWLRGRLSKGLFMLLPNHWIKLLQLFTQMVERWLYWDLFSLSLFIKTQLIQVAENQLIIP